MDSINSQDHESELVAGQEKVMISSNDLLNIKQWRLVDEIKSSNDPAQTACGIGHLRCRKCQLE